MPPWLIVLLWTVAVNSYASMGVTMMVTECGEERGMIDLGERKGENKRKREKKREKEKERERKKERKKKVK